MGRSTKVISEPCDRSMARRNVSSIRPPNTKPSNSGAKFKTQFQQPIANQTKKRRQRYVRRLIVDRIDADAAENQDGRKHQAIGHFQEFHPQPHQRQVDDQQARLPIDMEAIMPQNKSGFRVITCGPGTMPRMVIAPTIKAITALGGIQASAGE